MIFECLYCGHRDHVNICIKYMNTVVSEMSADAVHTAVVVDLLDGLGGARTSLDRTRASTIIVL